MLLARPSRAVKQPLPDVLATAGMFVRAFQKPDAIGDHSFLGYPRGFAQKERAPVTAEEGAQRSFGMPDDLVLSKTAGARREVFFSNGLIAQPA